MNNGITYRCYIAGCIDSDNVLVSRKYGDKTYDTIDVEYVGHVVVKASH